MIDSGWFNADAPGYKDELDRLREQVWMRHLPGQGPAPKRWVHIALFIRHSHVVKSATHSWRFQCRITDAKHTWPLTKYSSFKLYWADPITLLPFVKGGVF